MFVLAGTRSSMHCGSAREVVSRRRILSDQDTGRRGVVVELRYDALLLSEKYGIYNVYTPSCLAQRAGDT